MAAGVVDMAGNDAGVGRLSGGGIIDISTGASTLTVGNGDGSSTFSGTIQNTAGVIALTKTGSGTLVLSGSSTYSGATTINGGTLKLDFSAPVAPTTNIINYNIPNSSGSGLVLGGGTLNLTQNAALQTASSSTA